MNFKNISDLGRDVNDWILRLPEDLDCVVGIPRSGLLVASMLSLKMNIPMTDIEGFLANRLISSGKRFMADASGSFFDTPRKILIVDDSISSGKAMNEAVKLVGSLCRSHQIVYGAVYVTSKGKELCDVYHQVLPNPRRFEWNILCSQDIKNYCFDMDGVLCFDPTLEENDDGPKYMDFIKNAKPLMRPIYPLGTIVTSRLSRYRKETEAWLNANNVQYEKLCMLDLPSQEERIRTGAGAKFKAEIYKKSGAKLFIESHHRQAQNIAQLSGKYVYSCDTAQMHAPRGFAAIIERKRLSTYIRFKNKIRRIPSKITNMIK